MKIRQQRTIEKNICKKMILLSFCMILMVSMEGCGNKRKEILRSQMSLMIRQESFMRNTTKILSNIIKINMERKSK